MSDDDISFSATEDSLILSYGSYIYISKGKSKTAGVSQKMRMLARLLEELHISANHESKSLSDFLSPEHFDDIVAATEIVWTDKR